MNGSNRALASLLILVSLAAIVRAQDDVDELEQEQYRAKMYDALSKEVTALERQSNALKMVVKLVRPTVVHIEADKIEATLLQYGSRKSHVEEAGSGCLIKLAGRDYVLTNRHVVKSAADKDITIRLADGRQIHPTRVWSDPDTDIAIMSVNAPGLVSARLGNSNELEIGDFVLAVGSPFGLSHSITFGIVSATARRAVLGETVKFQDFIQTDAAINPGNSGGPLINLRGEVVGMNTAIASSSGGNEGIGFSIPINMVMNVATQLVERNGVERAFLGVQLDRKFDSAMAVSVGLKRPRGARVSGITPGSPAEAGKLRVGDIVLDFGGVRVEDDNHLVNLVGMTQPGREVPLVVLRDQKQTRLNVKLGAAAGSSVPANTK